MLVGLDHGVAEIYDTNSLQPLSHFGFPSRISDAEFTLDGAKLMVLTADQTVYQLKTVPNLKRQAQMIQPSNSGIVNAGSYLRVVDGLQTPAYK